MKDTISLINWCKDHDATLVSWSFSIDKVIYLKNGNVINTNISKLK